MRGSRDSLLIVLGLIIGLAFYGPTLAAQGSGALDQIITALQSYVWPVLGTIFVLLIVRAFWRSQH